MNYLQKILKVSEDFFFGSTAAFSKTEIKYLNQAVDQCDLEYRMKQIERKHDILGYM